MRPLERQMTPDITQVVTEMRTHFVDSTSGAAAERAFVVPVFDQRQRSVRIPPDVVAFRIDGPDEFETDRFGRADQIGDVEDRPTGDEGDDRRGDHTDARLIL